MKRTVFITFMLLLSLLQTINMDAQVYGSYPNDHGNYIVKDKLYYFYDEKKGTAIVTSKLKFDKHIEMYWKSQYQEEHLVIVPEINVKGRKYKVTSIAPWAFIHAKIKSVVIPNTIETIDLLAFGYCDNMESVTIPNSVRHLDGFDNCKALQSVTIPNSVRYLDGFSGCKALQSILIPNSVDTIGDHCFQGCESLSEVVIPNSIKYIGRSAFANLYLETSKQPQTMENT